MAFDCHFYDNLGDLSATTDGKYDKDQAQCKAPTDMVDGEYSLKVQVGGTMSNTWLKAIKFDR